MNRRVVDVMYLLLFVWASMLLGLKVIATYIVPINIPGGVNRYLSNVLQVMISTTLVLIWLLIWRWLAKSIFWRNILAGEKLRKLD